MPRQPVAQQLGDGAELLEPAADVMHRLVAIGSVLVKGGDRLIHEVEGSLAQERCGAVEEPIALGSDATQSPHLSARDSGTSCRDAPARRSSCGPRRSCG